VLNRQDVRDVIAFLLGLAIVINQAFFTNDDLSVELVIAGIGLMGYGLGRWNGRHVDE